MKLKVLYEDNHLIAVDKPAGIPVEPGGGTRPLTEYVKDYLREKYNKPGNVFLGIIHRLDQPVTGVIVFAKTSKGASRLSEQIRDRKVKKVYHALVEGELKEDGEFVGFMEKDKTTRKAAIGAEGKEARLKYKVLAHKPDKTLVEVDLTTGRFHQIRAVMSDMGHPVLGDIKYGSKVTLPEGEICLRAVELSFKKPTEDGMLDIKVEKAAWENL